MASFSARTGNEGRGDDAVLPPRRAPSWSGSAGAATPGVPAVPACVLLRPAAPGLLPLELSLFCFWHLLLGVPRAVSVAPFPSSPVLGHSIFLITAGMGRVRAPLPAASRWPSLPYPGEPAGWAGLLPFHLVLPSCSLPEK